jgi:UDP-glucose 4-epimerase
MAEGATDRGGLRVAVTGATGNCGLALLEALEREPRVAEVRAVSRRPAHGLPAKAVWTGRDVAVDDLTGVFAGVDAVVHLAWAIQPSHDEDAMWRTNVLGTRRVADAAVAAGVPALVHASSIGVYSPGPDTPVDESWPSDGVRSCFYARHKADCERYLDRVEATNPGMRVVRARPALVFSRHGASRVTRLFAGPLLPRALTRPGRVPVLPWVRGLRLQAVHADDLADAYRRMILGDVRGAVNVAADPVLDGRRVARAVHARVVPVPAAAARALMCGTWRARLQPTPPSWLDMGLGVPVMDTGRARTDLGWTPRRTSLEALLELLEGVSRSEGAGTPPLTPGRGESAATGGAPTGRPGRHADETAAKGGMR